MKKTKHSSAGRGQGRKSGNRQMRRITAYIYQDQFNELHKRGTVSEVLRIILDMLYKSMPRP